MIPPHTNRYPKPPSGAATGWGRFFCVSDQGERAATGGAAKPLRPRKLGQSFGPEPLCRFATSPRAAGSHPTAWGAFCAGKARERSLPSQGRWPRSRPEGLLRFAAVGRRGKRYMGGNGKVEGRACPAPTDCCEWVANERGKGGRQPAPFAVDGGCPGMGVHAKPVGIPQAANAASPL